ncbi:S41 family peptidase [Alkalimonas collagenimarina]|uniref:S41 family peptidase n=1 Tax=Alkalimonas collagenimarina TaxID=400390 RepID=A0ABT9GXI9_9GAMM|nr:S41 family peptidase [Alkalimonas collagenimarina]MDP4535775.1 S41 family peptidase [Alkalimonas collagenimarina]
MNKTLLFLCATVSFQLSATANPWQQLAKTDLDFVYQNLKDNHPGVIDELNPGFNHWLEQGYQQALSGIAAVDNLDEVLNLQRQYIAGFADGHVGISFHHQRSRVRWPGIIVHKQGQHTVVTQTAEDWPTALPATGAILKYCNGLSPQQLLEQRVLPFHIQLPELAAVQANYTPLILRMDGSWQGEALTECTFKQQGVTVHHTLHWRNTSRQNWQQHNEAQAASNDFSLQSFAPNSYWLSLPTFTPSAPQQAQLKQMTSQLAELREAELIVFDVRGNGGGNSQWGADLAFALFGQEHVYGVLTPLFSQGMPYWRASADNTAVVAEIVQQVTEQFGADSDITQLFSELAVRMVQHGTNELVPQSIASSTEDTATAISPSLTTAKVVLLTDGACGSACLDFADMLLPLGTIHAGQPTFADTVYMDIRFVELPSKLGSLAIPQKVYRNRPRGHNEPYTPAADWLYSDDINHTEAVRSWLLQKLRAE